PSKSTEPASSLRRLEAMTTAIVQGYWRLRRGGKQQLRLAHACGGVERAPERRGPGKLGLGPVVVSGGPQLGGRPEPSLGFGDRCSDLRVDPGSTCEVLVARGERRLEPRAGRLAVEQWAVVGECADLGERPHERRRP